MRLHRSGVLWVLALASIATADPTDLASFDAGFENRLGLSFAPDGNRAYWVEWNGTWGGERTTPSVIYVSRHRDGRWSRPEPALPPGDYNDSDPFVSPDGLWLYFVSTRPTGGGDETTDRNIWRRGLTGESQPELVPVNSDAEEYSPVIVESGAIYFASDRPGGPGRGDIYRAPPNGDAFGTPEPLGPEINSPTGEWNVWVSADEKELMFEASSRPGNVSVPGDLYYSRRGPGRWAPALRVKSLNTTSSELMPRLHPDGKTLYFTRAPIGGHAGFEVAGWQSLEVLRKRVCHIEEANTPIPRRTRQSANSNPRLPRKPSNGSDTLAIRPSATAAP